MSPLFYRERRGWWVLAVAGSLALHVAGAALALDLLPRWPTRQSPPPSLAEITVSSLVLPEEDTDALIAPGQPEAVMEPAPPEAPDLSLPEGPEATSDAGEGEDAAPPDPVPPSEAAEETDPEAMPPQIPDLAPDLPPAPEVTENPLIPEEGEGPAIGWTAEGGGEALASLAPPALPGAGQAPGQGMTAETLPGLDGDSGTAPLPAPPRYVPPPPPNAAALRAMVGRIRDQIDLGCLLALPRLDAGAAQLLVMGDNDLTIRTASDRVLDDPGLDLPMQAVLLDRRQCPAVNFLRARGEYPAFGLSIGLVNPGILSGGRLIGRIEGLPEDAQTTLLLVDDNGVVQDLRRFLRFGGGTAEFDVPVTRDGGARDTSQLLIAAVTPARLDTVTNLGGRLAEEFFPALADELGQTGALAVIPFDLR